MYINLKTRSANHFWHNGLIQASLLPLCFVVGIVLCNRWHSMTQYHIGIIKGLFHLHGPIGTPSNIITFKRNGEREKWAWLASRNECWWAFVRRARALAAYMHVSPTRILLSRIQTNSWLVSQDRAELIWKQWGGKAAVCLVLFGCSLLHYLYTYFPHHKQIHVTSFKPSPKLAKYRRATQN